MPRPFAVGAFFIEHRPAMALVTNVNQRTAAINLVLLEDNGEAAGEIRQMFASLGAADTQDTGLAFAKGFQCSLTGQQWLILSTGGYSAHPFVWLAVRQVLQFHTVGLILGLAKGFWLTPEDEPAVHTVAAAAAQPYPALYENRDPYAPSSSGDAVYKPGTPLLRNGPELPATVTAYARHPQQNGGLRPWTREQFGAMSSKGPKVYSELPAGVYEGCQLMPHIPALCLCDTRPFDRRDDNPPLSRASLVALKDYMDLPVTAGPSDPHPR